MKIAVIGGGAAGFMAAITAKETNPKANVTIFEKTDKVLVKVKVSGGGRCNVTNATFSISKLIKNYPRGGRELKKSFNHFFTTDTVNWFESRGVVLKTEADKRMFPSSNSSQAIVDLLLNSAENLGIRLSYKSKISAIAPIENGINLSINGETLHFDKVIIAINEIKITLIRLFESSLIKHEVKIKIGIKINIIYLSCNTGVFKAP